MSLDRESITAAALGLLDEYGLPDVTMRRIATTLGVKAGALYWYFANKQTLLAALSDEILRPIGVNGREIPWERYLVEWSLDFRQALLKHRDSAEVVSSTRAAQLGSVDPSAELVSCLVRHGWVQSQAVMVIHVIIHFILGHVVEEQTRLQMVDLGVGSDTETVLDDEGFQLGIELLVSGIRALSSSNGN